ncbi:hypothetical protein LL295_12250 [Vibrio campbellii]|uniref:hypothetical protein n=1 Tax=Vibrio campbellii TaxID=680 RepID=UPI001D17CB81|nr:hypothetical protein [Vibrio campbellii]MCC4224297.1 hypothetical protein [Vibrio campbellii]
MNYKLLLLMAAMSSTNVLADAPPGSEITDLYLHAGNGSQVTNIYANGNMAAVVKVYYNLAEGAELQNIELRLDGIPGGEELPSSWTVTDENPNPELPNDITRSTQRDAKDTQVKYKYLTTKQILKTSICARVTTSNDSKDTCSEGASNRIVQVSSEAPLSYSIANWNVSTTNVDDGDFKREVQNFKPISFNIKKVLTGSAQQVEANFVTGIWLFTCSVPNAYVTNADTPDGYTSVLYAYVPDVSQTTKTCYYDKDNYFGHYVPPHPGCYEEDCGLWIFNPTNYNTDFSIATSNAINFVSTVHSGDKDPIDVRPFRENTQNNTITVWDDYGNEATLTPRLVNNTEGDEPYPEYVIE